MCVLETERLLLRPMCADDLDDRPSVLDPGDELVLEAAVATGSDWIVTHNIRHLVTGAAQHGIEAIRPGEALRRLGVQP